MAAPVRRSIPQADHRLQPDKIIHLVRIRTTLYIQILVSVLLCLLEKQMEVPELSLFYHSRSQCLNEYAQQNASLAWQHSF